MDKPLWVRHDFHYGLVGNHAEARCYLGGFLHGRAAGDGNLIRAANCFLKIHDACWKAWDVLGGLGAMDAYLGLRDSAKRRALTETLGEMKALDAEALDALKRYLAQMGR